MSCEALQPVVDRLEEEFGGRMRFLRIDFDEPDNRTLTRQYAISGVPYTVLIGADGRVIQRRGGNLNPAVYRADILGALDGR